MLGILWFLFWQALGTALVFHLLRDRPALVRLWLGSVTGSVLSMWAPIPFAFLWGFGARAHIAAAVLGALGAGWLLWKKEKRAAPTVFAEPEDRPLRFLLPPFLALWCFLLWSHTLRPVNGALYTGQCTYGDMQMHLGFITSLAMQQTFPPLYSILPGTRISYPFLCDSISASLYLLGTSLRWAYMIPMLFAYAQFSLGFWFFARALCREKNSPVVAFLLFFLNGGFGMIYYFHDYTLRDLFTGFYKTPTNLTDKGMRWVNVIADMLLPQRATLFGWASLMAALWLLYRAVFRREERFWLPAGILGGLLPMIHTHSFFALGLVAACWMVYTGVRQKLSIRWFSGWLRFGLTAVALATPQLLIWTFRSVGGNDSFLRLHFDWVNGGQENWLWFWLKNVGPLFVLFPAAFIFADRKRRAEVSGAVLIFVLCEYVVFQPNVYDNNKLLYVAYMFACCLCSDFLLRWLEQRSVRSRRAILTLFLIVCCNAGIFTLGREAASGIPRWGYEVFSADEAAASEFIRGGTAPDATFLTDDNHDNAVAVLTGRNIVCGSSSYLYFHGLDYTYQQQTAEQMLTDADAFERHRRELNVDYVYMGYYETAMPWNIQGYLSTHYPAVFSANGITIFDVR